MSNREEVVLALMRVAVTSHIIIVLLIEVGILSSSKHFMRIALV